MLALYTSVQCGITVDMKNHICVKIPTSVESLAVGEERQLEEQSAQKICSAHYTSHLINMKKG